MHHLLAAPGLVGENGEGDQSEIISTQIDEATLRGHIRFLADDLLEGRGPGSRGDDLTQLYLQTQFQTLGLQPAALQPGEIAGGTLFTEATSSREKTSDDSADEKDALIDESIATARQWTQEVPLIGVRTQQPESVTFKHDDKNLTLKSVDDFMSTLGYPVAAAKIDEAEIVFVGYGIQAPEYQWDDFKDVDVRGKVLLMMNNDPEDDPELFEGRKRLYYGRWDYKFKMAAQRGAAGAIIIHTTPSAGYPWQVIQTSWSGEEFQLRDGSSSGSVLNGWITEEGAKQLVELSGQQLDHLRQLAQSRDFQPVALNTRLSLELTGSVREQNTANVLGFIPGSDPVLRDQVLIFMAHHDHLGIGVERNIDGDNIYNGAVDNASGTAGLLAIAKAFAALPIRPKRTILFAAVGAEEQGLLGSQQFALQPPILAGKMAAVINIDGLNILGKTHDVNVIGNGKSNLDAVVESIASSQNRIVTPDLFPDRGYYYRSDQFSLAKIGVPGVYLHSGINVVGKPDGWGKEQQERWVEETYHQPSDEYQASWDLSGAIEDLRLLALAGFQIAQSKPMPRWTAGDEFEAVRIQALKQVGMTLNADAPR
ncbi:MAG: M20/M25/M40 family metallo-hydrolase [Rubripirellula sp.]|nr:M20/M25/M40 family metallo-hydrolase [Rubripirellula sp.]